MSGASRLPGPVSVPQLQVSFHYDLTFPPLSGLGSSSVNRTLGGGYSSAPPLAARPSVLVPGGLRLSCILFSAHAYSFSFHNRLSVFFFIASPHVEFLKIRKVERITFEKAEAQHSLTIRQAVFALSSCLSQPHPFALVSLPALL